MEILIIDSARRHDISDERIKACLFNIRGGKLLEEKPPKHLLAGFDNAGNALELVTIEEKERDLLVVIHAMKLQKHNEYLLKGDA